MSGPLLVPATDRRTLMAQLKWVSYHICLHHSAKEMEERQPERIVTPIVYWRDIEQLLVFREAIFARLREISTSATPPPPPNPATAQRQSCGKRRRRPRDDSARAISDTIDRAIDSGDWTLTSGELQKRSGVPERSFYRYMEDNELLKAEWNHYLRQAKYPSPGKVIEDDDDD